MDVYEFLETLNSLFPSQDKGEIFNIRVRKYAKLLKSIEENEQKKLDYDQMLDLIIKNYPYKTFPNYTEIAKHCVYLPEDKKPKENFVFRNYLVTTEDGHEYLFVTVPDSWNPTHSLKEFPNHVEVFPPSGLSENNGK